jgi:hypothetical protein
MTSNLTISKAAVFLMIGYVSGGVIVTLWAHGQGEGWSSGPAAVGLSAPTAVVYFFALWMVGKWRPISPTSSGMALAGCLCAFFPTFCGFFPVYFMRLQFAAPMFVAQLLLLLLAMAICARLEKTRKA